MRSMFHRWLGVGLATLGFAALLAGCEVPTAAAPAPNPPVTGKTLSSVTLSAATASLTVGATKVVTVSGTYSDNSKATITDAVWTTSDAAKATVSAGTITAVAVGSATITATKDGVSASIAVTVAAVVVDKTALTAAVAAANTLKTGKAVGTAVGNVKSQAALDAFTAAIAAAQAVVDDSAATTAGVASALTTLNAAYAAFSAALVPAPASYFYSTLGQVDIVATQADWGTGTTTNVAYTADATYNPCISLTKAGGWGNTLAFTGLTAGKLSQYAKLEFKIKAASYTKIIIKVPDVQKEYALSTGTALANGWVQMSIPVADFSPAANTAVEFAIFSYDAGTMYLTDIGLSGVAAADTASLTAAIAAANTLVAGKTVGTADGNTSQASKDTYLAAIAAAQSLVTTVGVTQAQIVTGLDALAAATKAFSDALVANGPTSTVTNLPGIAGAAVVYSDAVGASKAAITSLLASWSAKVAQSEVTVGTEKVLRYTCSAGSNISATAGIEMAKFDATGKTKIHFDLYAVGDVDVFKVQVVSEKVVNSAKYSRYDTTVTSKGNWVSYDLNLTDFFKTAGSTAIDMDSIIQVVFISYGPAASVVQPTRFYVDNVYFY